MHEVEGRTYNQTNVAKLDPDFRIIQNLNESVNKHMLYFIMEFILLTRKITNVHHPSTQRACS